MKQRRHALRHSILEQQTFLISNNLLKQSNDENKTLSMKINQLSDDKKDFITDCFINLAKFDFRKQFLIWFRDIKLDKNSPTGKEKAKEVEEGIEQTEQMITSLMKFISGNNEERFKDLEKQIKKKPKLNLKTEKKLREQLEDQNIQKQEKDLEKNFQEHMKQKENMKKKASSKKGN